MVYKIIIYGIVVSDFIEFIFYYWEIIEDNFYYVINCYVFWKSWGLYWVMFCWFNIFVCGFYYRNVLNCGGLIY